MGKLFALGFGAVTSAVGSAVCCSGPIVAAAIGVSGAGLSAFLPYRPVFLGLAGVCLWFGFGQLDRAEAECTDGACHTPRSLRRMKATLWGATLLVLVFGTSSRWLGWLIG